ncbi:MAG UNVERIFIED_CONTAM: hypothetical protein LVR29_22055 [Microcystis novacekii LVE1205-3]
MPEDSVLQVIGILKLIHMQIPEFVAISLDYIIRILLKEPEKLIEQIVEIHSSRPIAAGYIFLVNLNDVRAFGSSVLLEHFGMLPVQWR